jgi:ABC-type protease/lipase transport system fused ATPase/permease subunit
MMATLTAYHRQVLEEVQAAHIGAVGSVWGINDEPTPGAMAAAQVVSACALALLADSIDQIREWGPSGQV